MSVDMVLQCLRQLSPRDRLRAVVKVLPDLEQILPGTLHLSRFWEGVDVHVLAESQGVRPIDGFDALLGDWPEDEALDDFIVAAREWRQQNPA